MQPAPRTLFEKIWERHKVVERDGQTLLYIDRHYIHDGSRRAFEMLAEKGLKLRRPDRTFGTPDHYVPTSTRDLAAIADPEARAMVDSIERNAVEHGVKVFGIRDPRQGIIHVVGPEQGLTHPGLTIVCGDSHTSTHGVVGLVAATFPYLHGRPFAPGGAAWDEAVACWRSLPSDPGVAFDREVQIDAAAIAPMATWGTSPEHAAPITGRIPDPGRAGDAERRAGWESALAYMDLKPGTPIEAIAIDRVFIGSCTNSRVEDLRIAAKVVKGRKVAIPSWVVPGSGLGKAHAEAEGLDAIFQAAGLEWRDAGCSMCVGMNGDLVAPGQRCASSSNRNFAGRQGRRARTHLVSPAMAAAAAVTGRLTDVRPLLAGT